MPEPVEVYVQLLLGCARCGGDHQGIRWQKLDRPIDESTHWAPCPTNGQPILMQIKERSTKEPAAEVRFGPSPMLKAKAEIDRLNAIEDAIEARDPRYDHKKAGDDVG